MSTSFLHGVEILEIGTGTRPIRTVKSSVIGLIGTAGKGPVNDPTLILGSRTQAASIFGEYANDGFTIPAALDAIFDQGGASVVVINVADTSNLGHYTEVTAEDITFDLSGVAKTDHKYITTVATVEAISAPITMPTSGFPMPEGATVTAVKSEDGQTTYLEGIDYSLTGTVADGGQTITNLGGSITDGDSLIVEYNANTFDGSDFTLDYDSGEFAILSNSKILPLATITVDYKWLDPSLITDADVIGGVTAEGEYQGVHNFLNAKTALAVTPKILIAPEWTHQKLDAATANAVVAELKGIADKLSAVIVADCPNGTKEEAVQYRGDWGSDRVFCHYPFYKVNSPDSTVVDQPASARIAGLISRVDNDEGFWNSPSNHEINGIIGLSKPIDFSINGRDTVANYLNENEVATSIREQGFRLWGNRTTSSDPKWAFLSVRRTADMVQESVLYAHFWAVDKSITKGLVESIVNGVNDYLRFLVSRGGILGGEAWADPQLNTPSVIQGGELYIDFDFTATYPAEHITFRAHLVNDYITEIFD